MKKIFKFFTPLILLTLLLVPTRSAQAQGPNPDGEGQVIFGSNFTLKSDDTFDGNLVVFGGNVTIEEDANLNGDLIVIGGTIRSDGEVQGDVVVVGGQVSLEESARVTGDLVTIGGQLNRAEGAEIEGQVVNNVAPNITIPTGRIPPTASDVPDVPEILLPNVHITYNLFGEFARIFGSALLVACLGVLGALFFRDRLDHVSQAIVSQPVMTGGIGLLSIVVIIFTAITIIGIPLAFLGTIALAFAWLFGIISMGQEIGDRLAKAFRQDWTPVIATGLGTFVLIFIVAAFQSLDDLLPFMACVTWVFPALVGLLAIGAVVVTRFGTRPAPVSALTVYTSPTGPSEGSGPDSGQIPPAS